MRASHFSVRDFTRICTDPCSDVVLAGVTQTGAVVDKIVSGGRARGVYLSGLGGHRLLR